MGRRGERADAGWPLRINASLPLAELTVQGDIVALRLRGPFGKLTRAETLQATPTDLESVFPIRSTVRFRGVGCQRRDGLLTTSRQREPMTFSTRCDC